MRMPRPIRLKLPLVRDRLPKSELIRLRVSTREKKELQDRADLLGCTMTELLLGIVLRSYANAQASDRVDDGGA